MELHFARNMTIEKQFPCRVSTLAVQLDTLGLITPPHSQEWNKWFLVAFSIGSWEGWNLTIHKELPCFLSGEQHTPATGVNKCSNPDEGTLNEVSSLANEKFISSRNKYGAKGKAVLVSVGVFSHQNLVYFYTKLEAQYNYVLDNTMELYSIVFVGRIIFRCIGLHIK